MIQASHHDRIIARVKVVILNKSPLAELTEISILRLSRLVHCAACGATAPKAKQMSSAKEKSVLDSSLPPKEQVCEFEDLIYI
jgi:hypothetical protein